MPRRPQVSLMVISSLGFGTESQIGNLLLLVIEVCVVTAHAQPQCRKFGLVADFKPIAMKLCRIPIWIETRQSSFVRTKIHRRTDAQNSSFGAAPSIADMCSVLAIDEMNALLQRMLAEVIKPGWNAGLESKYFKVRHGAEIGHPQVCLFAPQIECLACAQGDLLRNIVEHHRAPVGRRKGSDEDPVKAARWCAAHGPGGITSKSIGHQPLTAEQGFPFLLRGTLR